MPQQQQQQQPQHHHHQQQQQQQQRAPQLQAQDSWAAAMEQQMGGNKWSFI
jgi:hypothetical protein